MLNKVDDQLSWLNFNSRHVIFDEISVINRLYEVQMLPNRFDYESLDVSCRYPAHQTNTVCCTGEQGRG
jgi:hypothetical protein